jgi:DMSO/TMAO reductase YedYZ heme-binding membrane subunit
MLAALVVELSVIHMIAIIADPYARTGIAGAVIPGAANYRAFPVALGSLAFYAATVTVVSASMAGATLIGRWWQPLHRLAWAILVLTWFHSVLAGSDTPPLRPIYAVTGLGLIGLTLSRWWVSAAPPQVSHSTK